MLCTGVLAAVAFTVVYPMLPGRAAELPGGRARASPRGGGSTAGGRLSPSPGLRAALVNTLTVTVVRQLISMPLAVLIAWLIARTNLPGRDSFIEVGFWAAFFLPSLTVTLSWILLLDPDYGLINTWLAPAVGGQGHVDGKGLGTIARDHLSLEHFRPTRRSTLGKRLEGRWGRQ